MNHVFQSAGEHFSCVTLMILLLWRLKIFHRNPDSDRGRDEQNGPPGMEQDGDIEVRSKSNMCETKLNFFVFRVSCF